MRTQCNQGKRKLKALQQWHEQKKNKGNARGKVKELKKINKKVTITTSLTKSDNVQIAKFTARVDKRHFGMGVAQCI